MQPQDLIRAAAKLLGEKGWAQPAGHHAVGADGEPVSLWGNTRGTDPIDTSRASFNPQAARLSIYGALVAILAGGARPEHSGLMWDCLREVALEELGEHAPGGTNYVHPLVAYNNAEGRTQDEVLAFMEKVAKRIETTMAIRMDATGMRVS